MREGQTPNQLLSKVLEWCMDLVVVVAVLGLR